MTILKPIWYKGQKIDVRKLGTGRNISTKYAINPMRATYDYRINDGKWEPTHADDKEECVALAKNYIEVIYLRPKPLGPYEGRW